MRNYFLLSLLLVQVVCTPIDLETINSRNRDPPIAEDPEPTDHDALATLIGEIAVVKINEGEIHEQPKQQVEDQQTVDERNKQTIGSDSETKNYISLDFLLLPKSQTGKEDLEHQLSDSENEIAEGTTELPSDEDQTVQPDPPVSQASDATVEVQAQSTSESRLQKKRATTKLGQAIEEVMESVVIGPNDVFNYILHDEEALDLEGGVTLDLKEDQFHHGSAFKLDKIKKIKIVGLPVLATVVTILALSGSVEAETVRMLVDAVRAESGIADLGSIIDETISDATVSDDPLNLIGDLNFRGLEQTAEANITGSMKGELFFIQNYDTEDNPLDVVIAGTLESLGAGTYSIKLIDSSSVNADCSVNEGVQLQEDLPDGVLTPDETGFTRLFYHDDSLTLLGENSIDGKMALVMNIETGLFVGCGPVKKI